MSMMNPFARHPRFLARLPRLIRFYIFNCLIGFAIAGVVTAAVIGFDFAGIGHLVTTVKGGYLAAVVFFMLNGIVFAGVQNAVVILSMADEDKAPPARPTAPATERHTALAIPVKDFRAR